MNYILCAEHWPVATQSELLRVAVLNYVDKKSRLECAKLFAAVPNELSEVKTKQKRGLSFFETLNWTGQLSEQLNRAGNKCNITDYSICIMYT